MLLAISGHPVEQNSCSGYAMPPAERGEDDRTGRTFALFFVLGRYAAMPLIQEALENVQESRAEIAQNVLFFLSRGRGLLFPVCSDILILMVDFPSQIRSSRY